MGSRPVNPYKNPGIDRAIGSTISQTQFSNDLDTNEMPNSNAASCTHGKAKSPTTFHADLVFILYISNPLQAKFTIFLDWRIRQRCFANLGWNRAEGE
jgi:hypothetical protein